MCKPQQRGWADKKTPGDLRRAIGQEQQIRELERAFPPLTDHESPITSTHLHFPSLARRNQ
jgi:hypothetical protein